MGAAMTTLLPVILQFVLGLLTQMPSIVTEVETFVGLLKSQGALTPDQQAQIDAALEAAYAKVQAG